MTIDKVFKDSDFVIHEQDGKYLCCVCNTEFDGAREFRNMALWDVYRATRFHMANNEAIKHTLRRCCCASCLNKYLHWYKGEILVSMLRYQDLMENINTQREALLYGR